MTAPERLSQCCFNPKNTTSKRLFCQAKPSTHNCSMQGIPTREFKGGNSLQDRDSKQSKLCTNLIRKTVCNPHRYTGRSTTTEAGCNTADRVTKKQERDK